MNNQWRDNADHMVVWADGTYDSRRSCDSCGVLDCDFPVHTDHYKDVGYTDLGLDEHSISESAYWDWLDKEQPLGGSTNSFGEKISNEFYTSNPDGLAEGPLRDSGISQKQHEYMQEAYALLTPKQKEAWDLVMREQLSDVKAAERIGITRQNVEKRLLGAKAKVAEYLRNKNELSA